MPCGGDRERYLESGMDDYVSKPIREEELFRALGAAGVRIAAGRAREAGRRTRRAEGL